MSRILAVVCGIPFAIVFAAALGMILLCDRIEGAFTVRPAR